MLTNLLCKAAVSAVLLNNNRKSYCLNEAALCPHPTVKSAAGNRVKKRVNCKFLEYHNQSFNLHFMF